MMINQNQSLIDAENCKVARIHDTMVDQDQSLIDAEDFSDLTQAPNLRLRHSFASLSSMTSSQFDREKKHILSSVKPVQFIVIPLVLCCRR